MDDTTHKFYSDVAEYIASKDGSCVVVGGVRVEDRPGTYNYRLVIDFTGRPPSSVIGQSDGSQKSG